MAWPFSRFSRRTGSVNVQVSPSSAWKPRGDYSLTGSEAIFGAVTLLSNTVASMHLRLYRQWDEATDHPLHRLLCYRPSPRMTPFTFWQAMETCRDTAGNCYALVVPDKEERVAALDVLDPSKVTVAKDKETGDLWYIVKPDVGGTMYISSRHMLHCRHVTASGDIGVNPVDVLKEALEYDDRVKEFSLDQVKGVTGAVVLDIPSNMGDPQVKGIIDKFLENYRRSSNSIIVLTGGAKASSISRSAVDPHVMDVDQITVRKVARTYNIPSAMLEDSFAGSYKSQEEKQLEFLERTVVPIARMYEAELNAKLLTYAEICEGYRFSFDVSDLMVADALTRGQLAQIQGRNGLRKINELRAKDGYGPVDGGDTVLVSRDLVPLGVLLSEIRKKGA